MFQTISDDNSARLFGDSGYIHFVNWLKQALKTLIIKVFGRKMDCFLGRFAETAT